MQPNQRPSVFLNAGSLCFSLPLWCDLSGTISRWWKCAALPLSLMEATVCYDDGIARVAKFTENEIHVIVRQSQTLPRGVCVCVCCKSRGLKSLHNHLLEKAIILFCLFSEWLIRPVVQCVWVYNPCAHVVVWIHVDGPTRSISWVEVWNQLHPRETGENTNKRGICVQYQQCSCEKLVFYNKDLKSEGLPPNQQLNQNVNAWT